LATIGRVIDEGAEPRQLAREIVEYLRGVMLIQSHAESALNLTADAVAEMRERAGAFGADQILRAIRLFNQAAFEARGSASPTLPLEMAFVEALLGEETPPRVSPPPPGSFSKPPSSAKPVTSVKPSSPPASAPPAPQTNAPEARARAADTTRAVVGDLSLDVIKAQWANVLAKIRPHSKQVEAWLRGCEPLSFDGETLTLGFFYELHKSRIENQPQDKLVIEKGLAEVFGKPLRVKCVLSPKKAKMQAAENDPLIRAAVNQFGAQIVDIH
jgi:DNA polymerase-3 subunit gamma/tau